MGIDFGCGSNSGSITHLYTGRHQIAGALFSSDGPLFFVKHVLELNLVLLKAGRIHVRKVVCDRVEIHLLGFHSGGSCLECS